MSKTLFPAIQSDHVAQTIAKELPIYRDVAWDFVADEPIFRDGKPVIVEGSAAVKVWAYHAIQVVRYSCPYESFGYGSELERLRGQNYQAETKQAEASRYIKEALLASPYITDVSVTNITFSGSMLHFEVDYTDIYQQEGKFYV